MEINEAGSTGTSDDLAGSFGRQGLEQNGSNSHNGGFQRSGDRIFAFVQGRVFAVLGRDAGPVKASR